MNKLYKNNELTFSLAWIVLYVVGLSVADLLSETIKIYKSITCIVSVLFCVSIYNWIKNNNLKNKYGLCKSGIPAKELLYYIPLIIIASINLWHGITINYTLLETLLYIISMLCVGFLEEIIFRGFLFKAMCKENLKTAIIVSSITFGIGHIVNVFNGSGMDLFSNLLQVIYAIMAGFMFTVLFYKTNSLYACIITHSILNSLSVFSVETTTEFKIISALILCVIPLFYTMYILKKYPIVK